MYRSIHSLCHNPHKLRSFLFPLIVCQKLLQYDWKPPVVNSVHWTWFGKGHLAIKGPIVDGAYQSSNQAMKSKEQNCAEAQIWGKGTKKTSGTSKELWILLGCNLYYQSDLHSLQYMSSYCRKSFYWIDNIQWTLERKASMDGLFAHSKRSW